MSTIRVAAAGWDDPGGCATLRAIGLQVFGREQRVPQALEWDEPDAGARHSLAYDAQNRALGCGRFTVRRKIGRMAVLADDRGQGVGQALPQHRIERAGAQGWPTASVDTQLHAQGFHERAGLRAEGEGHSTMPASRIVRYRTMRLTFASVLEPMRDSNG